MLLLFTKTFNYNYNWIGKVYCQLWPIECICVKNRQPGFDKKEKLFRSKSFEGNFLNIDLDFCRLF